MPSPTADTLRLDLQQRLQQGLSPMQVQYVKMLEMTGPEIEDEVSRALDENPALERADHADTEPTDSDGGVFDESAEQLQLADYRNEEDIPYYRLEARNYGPNDDGDRYTRETPTGGTISLIDSLTAQLGEQELSPRQMLVGRYIAGNIDDNGYLSRTPAALADDIAIATGLDVSVAEVKAMTATIRNLEPAGVGAVDLRDCLQLQLRRRQNAADTATADALTIVDHYFDLLSKMHYERLASAMGIDTDRLRKAIAVIRSLDPKPGSRYGDDDNRTRHITPDFIVEVDNDNITLSLQNNIPDLQIELTFRGSGDDTPDASAESPSSRQANAFIRQKRDEAASFIKSLRLRQETLFNVMSAISRLQHRFFITEDPADLRPMILRDIAELTGYDLSVISRATAGKYVATAGGVYPLKFFFNERTKTSSGDDSADISTHRILKVLREIIDNEDTTHPLSDEAITTMLRDQGYDIARRTVAKYRERLAIPVARLRHKL